MSTISDFNTIIQLGAGIHLAYALLEDIHKRQVAKFAEDVQDAKQELTSAPKGDYGHFAQQFGFMMMMMPAWQESIQRMVRRFIVLSALVAAADSGILIFAAFNPHFKVSCWLGCGIVSTLFIPMPVFLLVTYARTRFLLGKLTPFLKAAREISQQSQQNSAG